MAEVFIFGQIESADEFPDNRLSCRWTLRTGKFKKNLMEFFTLKAL